MNRWRARQAGFSMIEFLMTAFILAIGLLGLTMLQTMSLRSNTGSRSLNTAVAVGEGVLESIQSEGRQRMLFLKYTGSQPTTTYFNGATVKQYYAFDGTKLTSATNAFYTVTVTSSDVVAKSDTAGGTKLFTLVVSFTDNTQTRSATLTRQVAYA